jgi:hypothetical protein
VMVMQKAVERAKIRGHLKEVERLAEKAISWPSMPFSLSEPVQMSINGKQCSREEVTRELEEQISGLIANGQTVSLMHIGINSSYPTATRAVSALEKSESSEYLQLVAEFASNEAVALQAVSSLGHLKAIKGLVYVAATASEPVAKAAVSEVETMLPKLIENRSVDGLVFLNLYASDPVANEAISTLEGMLPEFIQNKSFTEIKYLAVHASYPVAMRAISVLEKFEETVELLCVADRAPEPIAKEAVSAIGRITSKNSEEIIGLLAAVNSALDAKKLREKTEPESIQSISELIRMLTGQ